MENLNIPRYILVVEDHYLQSDWICRNLEEAFPGVITERIVTELDFRSQLDEIAEQRPDVIILDVMLPWTLPRPHLEKPPTEVEQEGSGRAGIRCAKLLKQRKETSNIPIVLYTVLDHEDLRPHLNEMPPKLVYLRKENEAALLIDRITKLLQPAEISDLVN